MSFYGRYVLPTLTDLVMRNQAAHAERVRFVPQASGDVLEIGVGSGLNIPIYGREVRSLNALDPSPELLRMARRRADGTRFPVEFILRPAEAIPLGDGTMDTVVTTWTLCTIPDPVQALREIFVEHGRAPDPGVVKWQDRLTPVWRRIAGGCHLNRPIDRLLGQGGFEVTELEASYTAGLRVAAYLYRGLARRSQAAADRPEHPGSP